VPAFVRSHPWPAEQRKAVKAAQWVSREAFIRFQRGGTPHREDFDGAEPFHHSAQMHNTLSRWANCSPPMRRANSVAAGWKSCITHSA